MAKRGLGAVPWLSERQLGTSGSVEGSAAHGRAFEAVLGRKPADRPEQRRPDSAIRNALEHLAQQPADSAIVVFGRYDQARAALATAADEGAEPDLLRRLLCTIAFDFESATSGYRCPVFVDPTAAHLRGFDEKLQRYLRRCGQ